MEQYYNTDHLIIFITAILEHLEIGVKEGICQRLQAVKYFLGGRDGEAFFHGTR